MHTIKMIAPISGRVFPCNPDALKYLEKAGWKRAPDAKKSKTPVIRVNAKVGMRDDHLANEKFKADDDFRRLSH